MKKDITKNSSKYFLAIGRRKTSTASVMIYEGTGEIVINDKKFDEVFPLEVDRKIILKPLKKLDLANKFYFTVKTNGGGIKGMRNAIQLGIARALIKYNPDFKKVLKDDGFLTRDDRMVERKHTGFVKARKKPQYSKR